jgi:23S rRNA (guanosine2251-2'-O)-methyltransferase
VSPAQTPARLETHRNDVLRALTYDAPVTEDDRSPREKFLTVFGRVAVFEALADRGLEVAQVFVATDVSGPIRRQVEEMAVARGVAVQRVDRDRVTRVSGTGKQHQGVAADVVAPNKRSLQDWLQRLAPGVTASCVLLDGVTTPANVGMIIRSAVGAGLDGIVVPSRGVADLGPLVIKASAGLAFRAPLLRVRTAPDAAEALIASGFDLVALRADAPADLWQADFGPRRAFVLGGESAGVSPEVMERVTHSVRIPMADGVESLNVSAAAAIVFFEVRRRRDAAERSNP